MCVLTCRYACRLVAFAAEADDSAAVIELASPPAVATNGKQQTPQTRQVRTDVLRCVHGHVSMCLSVLC